VSILYSLERLDCSHNQLATLSMSSNTSIIRFDCSNNLLTSLNLYAFYALIYIDCSNNLLSSLDVSNNLALEWLICSNNLLTSLDVSSNTSLIELDCSYNNMATPSSVIGWQYIIGLDLDDTFIFFPQNDPHGATGSSLALPSAFDIDGDDLGTVLIDNDYKMEPPFELDSHKNRDPDGDDPEDGGDTDNGDPKKEPDSGKEPGSVEGAIQVLDELLSLCGVA
jgi:hypothetical protein